MATLRQIRRRIRGVQNIRRITSAMRMVATARLRRAQDRALGARPYAEALENLIGHLIQGIVDYEHPLLRERETDRRLMIVVTGDRGLCGGFNANVTRRAARELGSNLAETPIIALGSRGVSALTRRGCHVIDPRRDFFRHLEHDDARDITRKIVGMYESDEIDSVDMVYNEFQSVLHQVVRVKRILPITIPEETDEAAETDYIYEPGRAEALDGLLPKQLETQVWQGLLESNAAEQAARMNAMENATKSADEMIDELILERNRVRQAVITKEISEIVGGAEALKSS